jgi:hypothetical protein
MTVRVFDGLALLSYQTIAEVSVGAALGSLLLSAGMKSHGTPALPGF